MNKKPSILVTGASSGIGRACVEYLHSQNHRIFPCVRSRDAFESLQSISEEITPLILDVNDPSTIHDAVMQVASWVGDEGLGALVNNAGIAVGGPLEFVSPEMFDLQIRTNTMGPFLTTRAFLPLLRQHAQKYHDARVVNISSVSGLVAFPFVGPYAASKFALEALTEAWRLELASAGIHFSLIEPGPIKTPIWQKTREKIQSISHRDEIEKLYPGYTKLSIEMLNQSERKGIDPREVAMLVHKTLMAARPKLHYPIGSGSLFARLKKFIPDFIWEKIVKSELKRMRK